MLISPIYNYIYVWYHALIKSWWRRDRRRKEKKMNKKEIKKQFLEDCEEISQQCEAEGYPGRGSNYWLRVERLGEWYQGYYNYNPVTEGE